MHHSSLLHITTRLSARRLPTSNSATWLTMSMSLCLYVCLFVCLYSCLYVCIFASMYVRLCLLFSFLYTAVCVICQPIFYIHAVRSQDRPWVYLLFLMSVCMYACISVCTSIYLEKFLLSYHCVVTVSYSMWPLSTITSSPATCFRGANEGLI